MGLPRPVRQGNWPNRDPSHCSPSAARSAHRDLRETAHALSQELGGGGEVQPGEAFAGTEGGAAVQGQPATTEQRPRGVLAEVGPAEVQPLIMTVAALSLNLSLHDDNTRPWT